jgi:hypothetical protein
VSQLSRQYGILNISEPCRPPQPVTGIVLLYFLLLQSPGNVLCNSAKSAFRFSSGTTSQDVSGRFALSHQWDEEEPRLLVCEAKLLPRSGSRRISIPQSEPTSGVPSSRRASSSTMTMPVVSDSDNNSKVSVKESDKDV